MLDYKDIITKHYALGMSGMAIAMYHIGESMKKRRSKEDFVTLMERKGYKMIWTDTRAQITFICPNGKSAGETVCTTQNTRKEILNMCCACKTGLNCTEVK